MARDISKLHPRLQDKIKELMALCEKNGITIKISECVRTVAEQDALYAKGRTAPGGKVTNARGSSYSSMHQWGVAFDFFLDMDVDGDGQKADDAYNNKTKLFNKVGALGQSIGLEWGGAWKSICDTPHFQLPDWGSTPSKLKQQYGTPDKFMATWKKTSSTSSSKSTTTSASIITPKTKITCQTAKCYDKSLAKEYKTTTNLNFRTSVSTTDNSNVISALPKGERVRCYGYYNVSNDDKWLLVTYDGKNGYCCMKYLKEV